MASSRARAALRRSTTSDTRSAILNELKSQTQELHAAAEQLRPMMRLTAPDLTRAEYAALLQKLLAFHLRIEAELAPYTHAMADADLDGRSKSAKIISDLHALGETPNPLARLARETIRSPAEAWGAFYVVEGSTLGGRVILKDLKHSAAAWRGRGLSHFEGYAEQTAARWREATSALERFHELNADEIDAIIRGAQRTFALFIETVRSPHPS